MLQQKVWIVKFGGSRYFVAETTAAALQQSIFGQAAIAYADEKDAIAACHQHNENFERRKQRQLTEAV